MSAMTLRKTVLTLSLSLLAAVNAAVAAENPYLGDWALTIPGGNAGWLGVREKAGGQLDASMLWGFGSVMPLDSAALENGTLVLTRKHVVDTKDKNGKKGKRTFVETIKATAQGDNLKLTSSQPRENGTIQTEEFTGKRQPPMPPAPNLNALKFGKPEPLFNGKNLDGWRLTDPGAVNGWSVKDGLLVNNPEQPENGPHKNYGNLRTDRQFEDFNLKLETRLPKGGNSGVYLRGIYEIQVADTFGKPLDPHNMGALYSRIKPSVSAEKPAGEWQTMDITLADRHVTVVLNGKKIIDNQPVEGCTGGALWSDVTRPGPLYLQGDHTGVEYRNIVLRPVLK